MDFTAYRMVVSKQAAQQIDLGRNRKAQVWCSTVYAYPSGICHRHQDDRAQSFSEERRRPLRYPPLHTAGPTMCH